MLAGCCVYHGSGSVPYEGALRQGGDINGAPGDSDLKHRWVEIYVCARSGGQVRQRWEKQRCQ